MARSLPDPSAAAPARELGFAEAEQFTERLLHRLRFVEATVERNERYLNMDMVDNLITSKVQSDNMEQYEDSFAPQSSEQNAGIPTGLAADIEYHMKRRTRSKRRRWFIEMGCNIKSSTHRMQRMTAEEKLLRFWGIIFFCGAVFLLLRIGSDCKYVFARHLEIRAAETGVANGWFARQAPFAVFVIVCGCLLTSLWDRLHKRNVPC